MPFLLTLVEFHVLEMIKDRTFSKVLKVNRGQKMRKEINVM